MVFFCRFWCMMSRLLYQVMIVQQINVILLVLVVKFLVRFIFNFVFIVKFNFCEYCVSVCCFFINEYIVFIDDRFCFVMVVVFKVVVCIDCVSLVKVWLYKSFGIMRIGKKVISIMVSFYFRQNVIMKLFIKLVMFIIKLFICFMYREIMYVSFCILNWCCKINFFLLKKRMKMKVKKGVGI